VISTSAVRLPQVRIRRDAGSAAGAGMVTSQIATGTSAVNARRRRIRAAERSMTNVPAFATKPLPSVPVVPPARIPAND
jgi:hypothetical protein